MKKIIFLIFLIWGSIFISSCGNAPTAIDDQQVQIYFKYGFNNVLNTFENTYQKDLAADGTIKVKFWLTTEEQNRILEKVNTTGFFSLRDMFMIPGNDSITIAIHPSPGPQILRIKYLNSDKTTVWTYPLLPDDADFNKLLELEQFIITIIESKKEYKKLPPSRGGYV